jgi:hypothetical protein
MARFACSRISAGTTVSGFGCTLRFIGLRVPAFTMADVPPGNKVENCPTRDEPEREVRFQHVMSLKSASPFPSSTIFQNSPRRQGFASPRNNGAPLTAPGRSEARPNMRERGNMQTQTQTPRL